MRGLSMVMGNWAKKRESSRRGWLIGTASLAFAFVNASAQADWQGAKWKMSQDDVRAAFKLPLRTPNPEERTTTRNTKWGEAVFVFDYKFRSFPFDGSLYFLNSKLEAIQLASREPGACASAMVALTESYGHADPIPYRKTWRDRQNTNAIAVFHLPSIGMCIVQYTVLDDGENSL